MKAATVYATRFRWAMLPLHDVSAGHCSCSKGEACPNGGKHPRLNDWVEQATANTDTVLKWAGQWPAANLGVATGKASGFFVLDIDGERGAKSLEELTAKNGPLPHTVQATTGSGGTHFLFTMPDFPVANSASRIAPGLDVRGDGGQIVVAPSRSAKGAYFWVHAPWNSEIAPAPAWLLELLRPRASAPRVEARDTREAFPPASPEVLEEARAALEAHGPAIEGQGGDEHTFKAAALLVNDFALTFDEALPLATSWNSETCQPPWALEDLEAKLRYGAKYATRPYGCKRSADAVVVAREIINAWLLGSRDEQAMWGVIARVRVLAANCGDPAKHGAIQREICGATGLGVKQVALPPVVLNYDAAPVKSGEIELRPEIHDVADKAIAAMAHHVFQRCGVLCEVIPAAERTFVSDLEAARVQDLMSRSAKWVRRDDQGISVKCAPPMPIAQVLTARRIHKPVRVLEAVTTAPVFLADGSILQDRGYNAQSRVYLEPSVCVDVPAEPTRDDARSAVGLLAGLLSDFRFTEKADFSAWVAGVLSPLVKSATGNAPAPLVCVSAASPGAGKSLLTDLASAIVMGGKAEQRTYSPRDPGEWTKRVTAYVRAASPISVFDNVNGTFGNDETLDRLLTSSTWSDRVLGASEAPPIPIVTTWWATGNNIEPTGDTVRRVLMVRLEVNEERPQERTGFQQAEIFEYALEHRGELLSAALTILRAFHVAGRPVQALPAWGSFTTWSALVRGALVWAGAADPFLTQRRVAATLGEADNETHDFWISVVNATDGSPASIVATANQQEAQKVIGLKETLTTFNLRRYISRWIDRPRKGCRIRKVVSPDCTRYHVEVIS